MASTTLNSPKAWPNDDAMDAVTDEACQPVFVKYVGMAPAESQLDYYAITADHNAWNDGDHTVVCMLFDPSRHELRTPLQGSAQ